MTIFLDPDDGLTAYEAAAMLGTDVDEATAYTVRNRALAGVVLNGDASFYLINEARLRRLIEQRDFRRASRAAARAAASNREAARAAQEGAV